MNQPKVSVIIPNYNHARFLEKRIRSVLDQTYQNIEIIYLDDASTDQSAEIFAQFSDDPRIKSIMNTENSGSPFKQWNKGVREATGEYIWIAESDDFADERLLETLVEQLETHPNIGVSYCQSWEIDENNTILSKFENVYITKFIDQERWKKSFTNSGQNECRYYLILHNTIPNASAALIRRSVYLSVGGAPENMKLCGDWLFWAKVLFVSDISYIAEPLNYFRKHQATARERYNKNGVGAEEAFQVVRYISHHIEVPQERLEKSIVLLIHYWLYFALGFSIPIHRNFNIYKMAKHLSPNINIILLKKIVPVFCMRMLGEFIRIVKLCFGIERPLKDIFQEYRNQIIC